MVNIKSGVPTKSLCNHFKGGIVNDFGKCPKNF